MDRPEFSWVHIDFKHLERALNLPPEFRICSIKEVEQGTSFKLLIAGPWLPDNGTIRTDDPLSAIGDGYARSCLPSIREGDYVDAPGAAS